MRHPRKSIVLWTALAATIGVALIGQAIWALVAANQTCFLNYPAIPCPGGSDAAVTRLTVGFVAVPLVWLLGIVLLSLRGRRARSS